MKVLGVVSAMNSPKHSEDMLPFRSRHRPQSKGMVSLDTAPSHLASEHRHYLNLKQHQHLAGKLFSYALDKLN